MKKILIFLSLALLVILALTLWFAGGNVQTFQVEKAYKAKADGKEMSAGQTIDENTIVKIDDGGYLLFVDNENKKRYFINTSCYLKVKKLVGKAKAPTQVTMSYLESLFKKEQNDKYTSAGSVNRGDGSDGEASAFGCGPEQPDSAPKSTGEPNTTTPEETISLYLITP